MSTRRHHWETVYRDKEDSQLSWFEPDPALSLELVVGACSEPST